MVCQTAKVVVKFILWSRQSGSAAFTETMQSPPRLCSLPHGIILLCLGLLAVLCVHWGHHNCWSDYFSGRLFHFCLNSSDTGTSVHTLCSVGCCKHFSATRQNYIFVLLCCKYTVVIQRRQYMSTAAAFRVRDVPQYWPQHWPGL